MLRTIFVLPQAMPGKDCSRVWLVPNFPAERSRPHLIKHWFPLLPCCAFAGCIAIFSDISYSVPHPSGDGNLELLSGISGFCKPGEVILPETMYHTMFLSLLFCDPLVTTRAAADGAG